MMTLREKCLELPYRERINLCAELQDSIVREKRDGRNPNTNRGETLLGYMAEIIGETIQCTRETRFVWARTMVVFQLLREGYTTIETGRMMGKDHSTIVHLRGKMQDALDYPFAYKDIIDIWKQFQNKIQDEIHRATDQDSLPMGGAFPLCSQC